MEARSNLDATQRSDHQLSIGSNGMSQPIINKESMENDNALEKAGESKALYKPRPQLPKPLVAMRTLSYLMTDLDNGSLDVDPEYQREVIWAADRMTGLINSLMENFYIPPIILNKKRQPSSNDGESPFVFTCVDGKQRLSSVQAFIKGMIPCHDHQAEKWWFCDTTTNQRKRVLPDDAKNLFLAKELVSFEFSDLSSKQEEDLFARVQMGIQLSAAERMRASSGPWQELARLFVDDFPVVYSLMKNRSRAKDFQLTLSCFSQIIEVMNSFPLNEIPILKTNHTVLAKFLGSKGAVKDDVKARLASIWNTFTHLIGHDPTTFTNENQYLKRVHTFAPVEMVAVTVMVSMHSETRNIDLLLNDIKALRIAVREEFADLRLNVQSWKFIWGFIENLESFHPTEDRSTTSEIFPGRPSKAFSSNRPILIPHSEAAKTSSLKRKDVPVTKMKEPGGFSPSKLNPVKKEKEKSELSPNLRSQKRQKVSHGIADVSQTGTGTRPPNKNALSVKPQAAPDKPGKRKTFPENKLSTLQPFGNILPKLPSAPRATASFGMTQSRRKVPEPVSSVPFTWENGSQMIPAGSNFMMPTLSRETISLLQSQTVEGARTNRNSTFRAGLGALTPFHTEEEWTGVLRSPSPKRATPLTEPSSSIVTSSTSNGTHNPAKSSIKPRKNIKFSISAHPESPIDLTSDTEIEKVH